MDFVGDQTGIFFLLPPLSPPPSMTARVAGCHRQWQPAMPSSLRPWFSTIATAFFSLGDVEREGKREKEGRKRERGGDYATGDDVGRPVSLGREGEAREEKKRKKKGNLGTKNAAGLECIKKI